MNIIEAEDMVKGLPDQVLFQEAQFPSGRIPQYLAVSEVQRRQDMRQRFQAQQAGQEQPTVKDQILQGGIAAVGGPPPQMQPPSMAPPMAPPMQGQPPVMAAAGGMMPYTMQKGGSVPQGQQNPSVFREFMRRNFATPQGLAANIGLVGGAMLGGPVGAGIGGNLGTYIGQKISPAPPPLTDMEMQRILGGGMRAPAGGAVGGGGGGGLPYGGPTSYNNQSYLRGLIDQFGVDQFGGRKKPTVTVEEIPQPPQGMAVGGMVPSRISDAIGSALTPAPSESQSSLPSTGPSRDTVLRKIKALMAQGREMDALVLLRQHGISPSEVSMAIGGMTPGGIVYMQQGGTAPNDPGANMLANMLSRVPQAYSVISKLIPAPVGISAADLERFRPTSEQYFDPEFERRRNAQLEEMKQMGIARKAEDIAAAERYLKEAEAPIQAAQDEARQAAISSTLMRLGAGLAAGKPEEGLSAAAQGVEQTMGRAREVAAAERRAARQDYRSAEREAVRGQRAMADQVFAMQAQNITNDENKQIQLINSQQQFAQWAFTQQIQAGRDQRAAFENSLNLAIGISKTIDETIRSEIKERGANQRQYEQNVISIYDKVNDRLKNIDEMIDRRKTITDPTGKVINNPQYGEVIRNKDGEPVPPTNEYLQQEAVRQTRDAMRQFNLVDPSTAVTVTYNGQTFKFPTKEDADKFRAAVGAK